MMEESINDADCLHYTDARLDSMLHAIAYGLAWIATELERKNNERT